MLQWYGFRLGLKLFSRGEFRFSLPFLIIPVNYWRTLEYGVVFREGAFTKGDKVLDIGSPKLFSLYLADVVGSEVYATDIEQYFIGKFEKLRSLTRIPPTRLRLLVEDGRSLSFEDNSFNKVFAISVIEHIPGEGDTTCVQEMKRVLSPGGRCIITIPFSPESKLEYQEGDFYWARSSQTSSDGKVFFQRRYSEADIMSRIVNPSGMKMVSVRYVGEKILQESETEFSEYLPKVTGHLQPLLSRWFHTQAVPSWRDLRKPLCAVVVLEK